MIAAVPEKTLVYVLCKENERVAKWRKAKYVSRYFACSCANANSALGEESSLVEGPPAADETPLVDGTSSAATDAFHNAAVDREKETSNNRMETMARVLRGMQANEDHEVRMQRSKKQLNEQENAVRNEHAGDVADVSFIWYKNYSKECIVEALWDAKLN